MTARIAIAATIGGAVIIAAALGEHRDGPDDGITWSPYGPPQYGRMHHIPLRVPNAPDTTVWAT